MPISQRVTRGETSPMICIEANPQRLLTDPIKQSKTLCSCWPERRLKSFPAQKRKREPSQAQSRAEQSSHLLFMFRKGPHSTRQPSTHSCLFSSAQQLENFPGLFFLCLPPFIFYTLLSLFSLLLLTSLKLFHLWPVSVMQTSSSSATPPAWRRGERGERWEGRERENLPLIHRMNTQDESS